MARPDSKRERKEPRKKDVVRELADLPEKVAQEKPKSQAAERLTKRVEALRARALERGIRFPASLEDDLRAQKTKGAIQRAWKAHLQSEE